MSWLAARAPLSRSRFSSSTAHGGKQDGKLMVWDNNRATTDQFMSWAKQTWLGPGLNVVYCQLKWSRMVRNKGKTKTPSSHPLPSSQAQIRPFTPDNSTSPAWNGAGDGEWGLWSVQNGSSLPLLPPYTFSCSAVSSPQSTEKYLPFHSLSQNCLLHSSLNSKYCISKWCKHLINWVVPLWG